VHKVPVVVVTDVGPEVIQQRFHDRSLPWLNEVELRCGALKAILSIWITVPCASTGTVVAHGVNARRTRQVSW
jgi:hypothetical protein